MCSNIATPGSVTAVAADVVERLARAIDDCAAVARHPSAASEPDLAERLATLWTMLTDADPELAARTAKYSWQ
jgi:hypothetical protein